LSERIVLEGGESWPEMLAEGGGALSAAYTRGYRGTLTEPEKSIWHLGGNPRVSLPNLSIKRNRLGDRRGKAWKGVRKSVEVQ